MKLDQNSISARLFRWFYATNGMPKNLCPYFWKLVLMWGFILPYTILSLPVILMDLKDPNDRTTLERTGAGAIIWFLLGMVICMLSWVGLFFTLPTKNGIFMHILVIGGIGWIFSIVIGGIELFKWAKEKLEKRNIKYDERGYRIWPKTEPKQDPILISFIKAKYNKYCPSIEWTQEKTK